MSKQNNKKNNKGSKRGGNKTNNKKNINKNGSIWVGLTVPPRMRARDNQTYQVMQTFAEFTITQTTVAGFYAGYNYQAVMFDQFSSWSTVFDQYKIDEIQVTFRPVYTANPLTESAIPVSIPMLYTVVDYDDSNAPTSTNYLREYENCSMSLYETVVRTFRPHVAVASFSGTFAGYNNVPAPWIDCASSTVQHYGVKIGIDPALFAQASLQSWIVTTCAKISFKNVH